LIRYQYKYAFDTVPILTAYYREHFITLQWNAQVQGFIACITNESDSAYTYDMDLHVLKRRVQQFFRSEPISQSEFERMINV